MTRSLKFRTFDGVILPVKEVRWVEGALVFSYVNTKGLLMTASADPSSPNHKPLMQFTGLKDRNGEDIWESDIFKAYAGTYRAGGTYPEKLLVVSWDDTSPGFFLDFPNQKTHQSRLYGDFSASNFRVNHGEIVGNTYQNNDLLK